jgi:translation elongation factor EF-4
MPVDCPFFSGEQLQNTSCGTEFIAFARFLADKCYGRDVTRKKKLLEKQKKDRTKMKQIG